MVETNVLDNQLQTGQVEMPTLVGAVKDSGVVDVTLEEGEQQQETISREGEQIGKHESLRCFAIVVARRDCVHNLSLGTQKV